MLVSSTAHFVAGNVGWTWGVSWRVAAWVASPELHVAAWPTPSGAAAALGALFVVGLGGWYGAGLVLSRSPLLSDRPARLGLAVVAATVLAGYVGTIAIVLGRLDRPSLIIAATLLTAVLAWCARRASPTHAARPSRERLDVRRPRWPLFVAFGVGIPVAFVVIHAAFAPVTEWDSLIYHAARPLLWFEARPAPPLEFGPSVGLQISDNYPPLHAATGAALYTIVGRGDDLYLRVLSPLLFVGLLLLVYGYARWRLGAAAAALSVALLTASPLMLMYAGWPTSYVLLTCCTFAFLVCCDLALETGARWRWAVAGLFAGLSAMTGFFGWLTIPVGLALAFTRGRLRDSMQAMGLVVGVALLVASPWLVRNAIRVDDPLYPLGSPLFDGRGLSSPLWQATQDEIRNNALAYWSDDRLRPLSQLATLGFDRHLLPVGSLVGLLALAWAWRRGAPWARVLCIGATVLLLGPFVPGWFWLRSLTPALPALAIGSAAAVMNVVAHLVSETLDDRRSWSSALRRSTAHTVVVGLLVICATTSTALAVAGSSRHAWTTSLSSSADFLRPLRELGGRDETLWTAFHGDALAWRWLNEHTTPGDGIATLDVRIYYLQRSLEVFYLDGHEAAPLLGLRTADDNERYLDEQGVRFVVVPAWAIAEAPTRHPAVDLLPIVTHLGGPRFPLVASFAPTAGFPLTTIYSVGGAATNGAAAIYPGVDAPPPRPDGSMTLPARTADARILVMRTTQQRAVLDLEYLDDGAGRIDLNVFRRPGPAVALGAVSIARRDTGRWCHIRLELPRQPELEIGLTITGRDARVRRAEVRAADAGSPTGGCRAG